jgi:UDP-N-acetylglucosamine 2-epimerase (non-hydrolysing)
MKNRVKLLLVAGARPNFMKIAPLVHAIHACQTSTSKTVQLEYQLVHTGQHYDPQMSQVFFEEMGIPQPHFNLEVGSGSHAAQTAKVMTAFESVCERVCPDWLVVVGDVNSTMACTLVASKLGTKVAHLEAGLRSFDRSMPEEINRVVTDALADLLLTPSSDADENLKREGVAATRIVLVGNIMIDTLVANLDQARRSRLPGKLGLQPKDFVYVTLHRPANVDDRDKLGPIMHELKQLAERLPVVFPLHPRTRKMLKIFGIDAEGHKNLALIDPIGYHDSLCLTEKARFILTDSGGLQEESTYLRTRCLTLRPNTERPVTIQLGTNSLTTVESLSADIEKTLKDGDRVSQVPPLWDGKTADRVLQTLVGRCD